MLFEKLIRVSVTCLDQPDLVVVPILQRRYDVLLGLGPTRIQNLRLDVERSFVTHIESFVEDQRICFEDASLLIRQYIAPRFFLCKIQAIAVEMALGIHTDGAGYIYIYIYIERQHYKDI